MKDLIKEAKEILKQLEAVVKEHDKPPVWHTVNEMDLPEWAKQQALRDIEQMPEEAWIDNTNPFIEDSFGWMDSNSGCEFWSAIYHNKDTIFYPDKWLIPEDQRPSEIIRVPEEIRMVKGIDNWFLINTNNQSLGYNKFAGYTVGINKSLQYENLQLIPCKYGDVPVGRIFFEGSLQALKNYYVKGDKESYYWRMKKDGYYPYPMSFEDNADVYIVEEIH